MDKETRGFKFELRADEAKPNVLRGYAALFNTESADLGGFVEVIRPSAFTRSLKENQDILALAQHDTSKPLARRSAGTLKIEEDDKGLLVEINLGNTSYANDTKEDVKIGNVRGMSFGFSTRKDAWTVNRGNGLPDLRELIDVDLYEVSPVTFPAYEATSVALRNKPQPANSEPVPAANLSALKRLSALLVRAISIPT